MDVQGETTRITRDAAEQAIEKFGYQRTGPAHSNVTTTVIATPEDQGVLSSAVQFAEDAVHGATSLAAGVALTGAELYVGVGAKILDAAGCLVRRGVGAMCYVQERGAGAVGTVKTTVNSVQQRGNEVLARSASAVLPTAAAAAAFGADGYGTTGMEARTHAESGRGPAAGVLEEASQKAKQVLGKTGEFVEKQAESGKGLASGILHGAAETVKQTLGKTGQIAEETPEAMSTTGEKSAGSISPVIDMGKKAAYAAGGLVAGTFQAIEQQGEKAAEKGLGGFEKGTEAAGRAAQATAELASAAVKGTGDILVKQAEALTQEVTSTAKEIESAGESAAESGMEYAVQGAEKTAAAAQAAPETAKGTASRVRETMSSRVRSAVSAVTGVLKDAEKQGEHAAEGVSSPGGLASEGIQGGANVAAITKEAAGTAKEAGRTGQGPATTGRKNNQRSANRGPEKVKVIAQTTVEGTAPGRGNTTSP